MRRSPAPALARLAGLLRREDGVAALEFALLAPILLVLLLGGAEVTRYIEMQQKAEKVAFAIADVLSQSEIVVAADVTDAMVAAGLIMSPYPFEAGGRAIVTSVAFEKGRSRAEVQWQCASGSLKRDSSIGKVGDVADVPDDLLIDDKDSLVVAEVYYRYEPLFTTRVYPGSDIYKRTIFRPRLGDLTTAPGC